MEKMIIHQDVHIADGRLLVVELTESGDELLRYFEQDELEYVIVSAKFSEKRKREFLGARLAIKQVANTVDICYTDKGKPYPRNQAFHLSISHSGNYIAIFTNPISHVGVDIEINSARIDNK